MSVSLKTEYVAPSILDTLPGKPIIAQWWLDLIQNANLVYARGGVCQPVYAEDGPITTTSTTYTQPDPLDALTVVWCAERPDSAGEYRIEVRAYGVDGDLRCTLFDPTVGTNAQVAQETVAFGTTPAWASAAFAIAEGDAFDGGESIPLALSFELRETGTGPAEVYQIDAHHEFLLASELP